MKSVVLVLLSFVLLSAGAVEWRNVDEEHRLAGRRASAGYLQGKVVLVVRWGAKNEASKALLPRIEELWSSFKSKPFVILGGHVGGWGGAEAVRAAVEEKGVTFPVYEDAGLAVNEPVFEEPPFLYVVDETGKFIYRGKDDRLMTQAVVQALTDLESPRSLRQWRRYLDCEFANLPAHAYLRLKAFKAKFPKEAEEYLPKARELVKIDRLKKVADLVEFAQRAKDAPKFGPTEQAKREKYEALVKGVLESCAPLRDVADLRLAQEAKNALADLTWAAAAF